MRTPPMILADLSPQAFDDAAAWLAGQDADWARHIAAVGPCLHRATPGREPYEALVRAIAYQQLHARAAEAILGRLLALFAQADFPSPAQLLAVPLEVMRGCGFSASKTATLHGIAQASLEGIVPDRAEALALDDQALIERLVALRGVGRWTVEMLLIYSLARSEIRPVDDFGVREGSRRMKGLDKAPTPAQMRVLGGAWSPYRTVAAWYLWRA